MNKLLTITESATFLGFSIQRLRYEVFHKRIPYYKIGRSIRFEEKELINWVLNQKQEVKNERIK